MSDEPDYKKPIKITISDPDTGEVLEEKTIANNYVIVTVGNRYVKSIQIWGRTHMLAVAVSKPGPATAKQFLGAGS